MGRKPYVTRRMEFYLVAKLLGYMSLCGPWRTIYRTLAWITRCWDWNSAEPHTVALRILWILATPVRKAWMDNWDLWRCPCLCLWGSESVSWRILKYYNAQTVWIRREPNNIFWGLAGKNCFSHSISKGSGMYFKRLECEHTIHSQGSP